MMKANNLTRNILIALVAGAVAGMALTFAPESFFGPLDRYVLDPVGQIFINLIMMLVVPLVFVSIVLGTAGLGEPAKLGRIGVFTITFFLTTTAFAISIGLALAYLVKPGRTGIFETSNLGDFTPSEAPPIMETLVSIIPANPIAAMSAGEMLQIIAFAVFIGVALAYLNEKTKGIFNLFEQANDILGWLVMLVMRFAPYGAFALIASAIGGAGLDAVDSMLSYMLTVIAGLLLHALLIYSLAIWFLGRRNPITFYKGFFPAMTVAFSTASSNATLPVSLKAAQENLGVKKEISSFVQPLGATINMDGTAIMQAVATVFIAQVYDLPLTMIDLLMVVLVATLASVGTAGVPGVGLIMLAMVLNQVGLPVEGIALIIGIDRILDMLRTSLNISGDAACAYILSEREKRRENKQVKG
ncbi:sodium:dicarboxylate symporter [Oceanobacillus oncorhynchi subsp. incaldanensis]|uniref:dicarboxylate/amino acid:cation symporter n=1 Tax=Oceanobacillus TaxID=182709 RepID=UPI001B260977|nr:dicarboxylate/amino acid:cation symporter [Oceanobacillus oncorhynchi]GIO20206.1 sodium:dicarboxylate symporter [Oceanobacillus oncorhynchi subsp. incaldanensis]